jgi:hypothetical protein
MVLKRASTESRFLLPMNPKERGFRIPVLILTLRSLKSFVESISAAIGVMWVLQYDATVSLSCNSKRKI